VNKRVISRLTASLLIASFVFASSLGAVEASGFPTGVQNHGEPIEGGVMIVGLTSAAPFPGMFNPAFQVAAPDGAIINFIIPSLLCFDQNWRYGRTGPVTMDFNLDAMTATLTMTEDIFWQDGVPLTLDDLLFAMEIISHPDYTGTRWWSFPAHESIVGIHDFRDGTADYIAGVILSEDNRVMTIHFEEMHTTKTFGAFNAIPVPRHHFEGIAIADMADHPNSRHDMIGFGPFIIDMVIPGEMVRLVRNDNFWAGAPLLDAVEVHIVTPALAPYAIRDGSVDVMLNLTWPVIHNLDADNVTFLAAPLNNVLHTGFRVGTMCPDGGRHIMDDTRIVSDVNLRRAMGYAINDILISEELFYGFSSPATAMSTPFMGDFWHSTMAGFSVFDLDLANRILDEAGYTERDAYGYRMTPDGREITLSWAKTWTNFNETIATWMIEDWSRIGIRVELWRGDFVAAAELLNYINNDLDSGEIDLFDQSFALGHNPDPTSLWGPYSHSNRTRYNSEELDAILARIVSTDSFDIAYQVSAMHEWQEYAYANAIAIPRRYGQAVASVNHRVYGFDIANIDGARFIGEQSHLWQLTATQPFVASEQVVGERDAVTFVIGEQGVAIIEGRTLVSAQLFADSFGFELNFEDGRAILSNAYSDEIVIILNEYSFALNGADFALDVTAQMVEGFISLPIRAVAEGLGFNVSWDEDENAIVIE